jgi:hypothetical protein
VARFQEQTADLLTALKRSAKGPTDITHCCKAVIRLANDALDATMRTSLGCLLETPSTDATARERLPHWPLMNALHRLNLRFDGCGWTENAKQWLITVPPGTPYVTRQAMERELRDALIKHYGKSWAEGTVRILDGDPRVNHGILGGVYMYAGPRAPLG